MSRDDRGRFIPGTSGNPTGGGGGRPPINKSISEAIRARGFEPTTKDGKIRNDQFADGLWDLALAHPDPNIKLKAMREILDRTEGRPPQKVDLTSNGESLVKGYEREQLDKLR